MKTVALLSVVTALMLAAVACERGEDAPGRTSTTSAAVRAKPAKASCDTRAELGTCSEYDGRASLGVEKALCEGFKGKFANGACPSEARVGSCTTNDGEVRRYYGSGARPFDLDEARRDCEGDLVRGTFAPES